MPTSACSSQRSRSMSAWLCASEPMARAIRVFAENLRHLLLAAPLGGKRVLGLDPGYRTGCKVAAMDEKGDLLMHDVVYPTHSESRKGRGSGSRRAAGDRAQDHRHRHRQRHRQPRDRAVRASPGCRRQAAGVKIVVVNEPAPRSIRPPRSGDRRLPTHDPTVRGAVSIGRRLRDPLAELVKIEPKSIGVGQYQHDVHQPTLKSSSMVVESCVNQAGVDVNTASPRLLQYVAGIGESLAKASWPIAASRGRSAVASSFWKCRGLGEKAFEQAAGFCACGTPLKTAR